MSALAIKLAKRAKDEGILPENFDVESAVITRLRAGHWQRSEGVWSWFLEGKTVSGDYALTNIGSQYTATSCSKAPKWDIWSNGFDQSIIPSDEEGRVIL